MTIQISSGLLCLRTSSIDILVIFSETDNFEFRHGSQNWSAKKWTQNFNLTKN